MKHVALLIFFLVAVGTLVYGAVQWYQHSSYLFLAIGGALIGVFWVLRGEVGKAKERDAIKREADELFK